MGGVLPHNPAFLQRQQDVGQLLGFFGVVRNVQSGYAGLALDPPQQLGDRLPRVFVHRTQRFIQAKRARRERERASQRHPLAFPAAEPLNPSVQQVADLKLLGEFLDAILTIDRSETANP